MKRRHTNNMKGIKRFFKAPKGHRSRAVPETTSRFKRATILMYAGVLAVGFGYLVVNKHVSTSGYELRSLEIELAEAKTEAEELELKAVHLQSLSYLQTVSGELALDSSEDVRYVTEETGAVALQN